MRRWGILLYALLLAPLARADVTEAIKTLKSVGPEGAGNEAAAKAWKELAAGGPTALFDTLKAFGGASPTAANWLRSAANAIAEREIKAGKKLDLEALTTFAKDSKQASAARRIAFELIESQDAAAAKALLPGFLNDPNPDLRRDAIAAQLKAISPKAPKEELAKEYKRLFEVARAQDQVEDLAKKLKEDAGVEVDIASHYGVLKSWRVSPEFSNVDGAGFAKAHDPEIYPERKGWKEAVGTGTYAMVDLNKVIAEKKEVICYGSVTVNAPADVQAEIRLASQNAIKVFVNEKEVYAREAYHQNDVFDGHIAKIGLKKGANEILVKVCQNNQMQPWTKKWDFAARLCDSTGKGIPFEIVAPKEDSK